MSKSYTMREMKSIVDYLVEHRAYAEIKGRKMWMSFASSKSTQRTWQSLKETFLKRILPDINNPYYKLSTEQICSFRQGMDFTEKNKDKLVLQPTNEKTNTSSSSPTTLGEIMEGNSNADVDSPKSVEPHHYNTIEELQKDLEASSDKGREEESVEIGHENQDLMTDDLSAKNCGTDIESSVAIIDKIPENASSSSQEVITSPNSDHNKKTTLVEKSGNCVESQIIINKNKSYNKKKSDVAQHQKTDDEKADKHTTKISPVIMQKKASTTPDSHLPNNPEEFMNGIDGKEIAKKHHLSVPTSEKNKVKKIRSRSHSKNVSSDLESGNSIKGNSQTQVATYNSHENQGSKVCNDDQNLNKDQVKNVDNEISTRNITKESVPSKGASSFVEHADEPGCSKYTMHDERVSKKPITNGIKTNNKNVKIDDNTKNEVVVLNSYSDSDSDHVTHAKEKHRNEKRKMKRKIANQAALAKMLGLSNGKNNPKSKETPDKNVECTEKRVPSKYISGSEISDTSDDEDRIEVRPKKTKCCSFKPPQPRELYTSGGGLFCSFGKATYPIVMNGQVLTDDQYLFMEENHTKTLKEEREFWKTKFLDQEKKTDHILEVLQRMDKKIESQEKVVDELRKVIADFNDDDNAPVLPQSPSVELRPAIPKPKKDKRIQIRFTTKNQDVRLKGEWSNICKEFNEMVKIFKSVSPTMEDDETATKQCDKAIDNIPVIVINEQVADNNITEEEAHENVTKLETEIFNQIAKADAAEKEMQEKQQRQQEQSNVTLRRRRPTATEKKALSSEEGASSNSVRSRSPQKKQTIDKVNNSKENKVKGIGLKKKRKPLRQSSRLSNQKRDIVTETKNDEPSDEDDDISIVPQTETSSSVKSFLLSESTRDYQTSDKCQSELYNKKKRKYSVSVSYKDRNKFKRNLRRRIESDFTNDASSESSNITRNTFIPFAGRFENSTLTNGVQETGKSHNAVQGINETYVISNHTQSSSQATTFGSSSITLPPSPGISSVENLSSDHTLKTNESCQKYTISNMDVSMPLLRQDCWVKRRTYRSVSEQTTLLQRKEFASANYTDSRINTNIQQKSALSETLLNKVANVNIAGSPTISASFNKKIHDLLLDSAKKIKSGGLANSTEIIVKQEEPMINANVIKAKKKVEPKKRSSTPLKRKSTRKSKPADIEPIIEEQMEYCSKSRSSQPSLKSLQQNDTKTTHKCNKIKNRQGIQKNVIKVKILRPKRKDFKVKNKYNTNSCKASLCGSLNIDMQHSDEQAHNHSETCLFVDEVDNAQPQRSQTALPQTMARDTCLNSSPKNNNIETVNRDATVFKPDFLNTPSNGFLLNNVGNILPTATPMYGSYDSLITNDISSHITSPQSQSRNSPWYLLSEDDTSKSNTISPQQVPSPIPPAIAQLFPITCAVPNLSTITEASREPDESQKKENIK